MARGLFPELSAERDADFRGQQRERQTTHPDGPIALATKAAQVLALAFSLTTLDEPPGFMLTP